MTEPPSPWRTIDPEGLAPPIGFSHAVVSEGGRRIHLAGQTALDASGHVQHAGSLVDQAATAFSNLARVLRAAGAEPHHLVRLRIYVTDVAGYRARAREIGAVYREAFGRWFPAMTLVGVARLYDDDALIEVEGEAVLP